MAETRDNWAQLPFDMRVRAVEHLRAVCDPAVLEWVRDTYEKDPDVWYAHDVTPPDVKEELKEKYGQYVPTPFHFTVGMQVRNTLRTVIKDDELPPVDYGDEKAYQNWDDYYAEVLECAAGLRDIDE